MYCRQGFLDFRDRQRFKQDSNWGWHIVFLLLVIKYEHFKIIFNCSKMQSSCLDTMFPPQFITDSRVIVLFRVTLGHLGVT